MGESSARVASWYRLMDECQTPYSTGSLACRTAACSVSEVLRCLVRVPYGPVGDGQVELVGTSEVSADHRAAGLDPAQERIGLGLQDPLPGHDPFP